MVIKSSSVAWIPYYFEGETGFYVWAIFAGVHLICQWYLLVWNLKHKGRSAYNLFYLFVPCIGAIIFLCIRNQEQLASDLAMEENIKKHMLGSVEK